MIDNHTSLRRERILNIAGRQHLTNRSIRINYANNRQGRRTHPWSAHGSLSIARHFGGEYGRETVFMVTNCDLKKCSQTGLLDARQGAIEILQLV